MSIISDAIGPEPVMRSLASQRLARDVARSKATPATRRCLAYRGTGPDGCLAFMGTAPEGHVAILTDGNDAARLVGVRAVEVTTYV